MSRTLSALLVAICACAPPAAAVTSGTSADGEQIERFERAYFDQYAPRTALEMIRRVPGFTLEGADNRRGLGQGGANVLINGERITGKTGVGAQLSRIAAANIVYIEIVDGASLDIPGLSGDVANIVTSQTGGISGTWEWSPEFRDRLKPNWFRGDVNVSGQKGNLGWTVGLTNGAFRNGNFGPETLTQSDGVLFERREEIGRFYGDIPGASLDLVWKPKPDHIANLNLDYNQFLFDGEEFSDRVAITERGEDLATIFRNSEDEWNASVGADYEFPAFDGALKLIGYYRAEHSPTVNLFELFDAPAPEGRVGASRFERVADEGEAIARTEYSWSPCEGRDWTASIEGAFNFLDIESFLFAADGVGDFEEVALDDPRVRVEEYRSEATLTHSRPLGSKVDVQASIGAEYSELSQSNGLVREFIRPKGFLSLSYTPDDQTIWRARLDREVGQLNFFDFISSVDIVDDLGTVGNVNLVPEQSWRAEVGLEKDFGQGNTFRTSMSGTKFTDLVDRIPVGDSGDAVGNIDEAYKWVIRADVTLQSERWGYKGLEFGAGARYRYSTVDDPLTQVARRLNDERKWNYNAQLRHDIDGTDLAYELAIEQQENAPGFRLDTINLFDNPKPQTRITFEHKDIMGVKAEVSLINLLGTTDDFQRQIFTDRRDRGVLDFTEFRSRRYGEILQIELSGTF